MKIMNIGYNQANQQYVNNKKNPTTFQACTLRIAQDAIPGTPSNFYSAISRILSYCGKNGLKNERAGVNVASHIKGEPASLTVSLPDSEVADLQPLIEKAREDFAKPGSGLTIELS